MLPWALTFFVIAIIAALLGARGVAGLSAEIGYFLVVIALIFVLISLFTGRSPAIQNHTGMRAAPIAGVGSASHESAPQP
jgi:uncharacterized membrane protein YtjA (UPF0391 family)